LIVLERLDLEDYVAGVVAAEVSEEDRAEALAAQAVAARSYAAALLESPKHSDEEFDLCSSTHCQRYAGRSTNKTVDRAVAMTSGEVLTVGDRKPQILRALFHACCGGHTRNAIDLWPSTADQITTPGVIDKACAANNHRAWTRNFSVREIFAALERAGGSEPDEEIASIRSIDLEETRDKTARRIRVDDSHGRESFIYPADFTVAVGRALGWNACPSPPESIRREGDRIILEGRGLGHGAGLCQHGAHAM